MPTQDIYIAVRAIAYGEKITPQDVKLSVWPKHTLPDEFFYAETPLTDDGQRPHVALRALEKNEAILEQAQQSGLYPYRFSDMAAQPKPTPI